MDERDDDLFGEDPLDDLEQDSPDLFEQDGPDLFAAAGIPDVQDLPEEAADPLTRSVGEQDAVDASLMEAVDARRLPERQITDRPETPLALYRRYRPETFAEVIGQEHVTEPLQRALENNRVNHAYLFSGPRGCGKTTSARILARCLNCEQGPTPTPCGVCQSCRDLARGGTGSIDVIEIDAASHGGVNEARDLRERAFFAPVHSRYKIYIIDEAHMVTKEGFNALLKVVEEPPPHVKFIFATTEPEKVLGTIRSRTHHYPFRLVPPKTLSAYLATLCDAEGIAVEPAVLPLVVRAGAGSVRDSLSVLDQLLGGAGPDGVSYGQATSLLGYTPDSLLDEIVDAFAAGDARGVFAAVDKVIEVGQDPRRFAEDLLRRLRDLIIVAAVPEALSSGLIDVAGDQADRLTSQANALGAGELTRAAEVIAVGLTEMRGTTAPRLHLELMCARVLLPGADADGRGIHARLDRLERRLDVTTPDGEQPPVAPSRPARGAAAPQPDAPVSAPPVEDAAAPHDPWAATPSSTPARKEPAPTPQNRTPAAAPPASPDPAAPSASVAAESDRQVVATPPAATPPATTPEAAPAPPAPPAPVSHRSATSGSATPLATADVRRLWPEILDNIKNRRRFTWILLSQNAQVVDVRDGVLTIGLANAGARDSFSHGGSLEVLRDAIVDILGTSLRIEPIIDATADDPAATASAPAAATTPAAEAAAPSSTSRSAAAEAARANIRPTRSAPSANTPEPDEPEPDPDDPVVAEDAASSEELLMKHLGAELIENPDL